MAYMLVSPREKLLQAIRLVTHSPSTQAYTKSIVYFPTCAMVEYFYPLLSHLSEFANHKVISLHGQLPPSARKKNFELFCNLTTTSTVLLTTDVAARGLDVPNVDLVVQLDPPQDPKNFSHRCGRAGRAGQPGRAVLFLHQGREEEYIQFLKVRGIPVEAVHRLDSSGGILQRDDDTAVDDLVVRFRQHVQLDRGLHDKVFTR